ncbi:hypothetical protein N788_12475 [Arenimonas donghaensis DSM 18148 = HO3-R19]|uniref:Calx-beta domain-containing protein n=1 Tax=Arenimonas donghaensis DSM 18148 = HO3-R19 TaxID=1121014 RepID=A0A087MI18_9GAMM|nr:hypothetical protein N788_12475 [Arenimonas donghaensis DSM 18148 = HO3-R19]
MAATLLILGLACSHVAFAQVINAFSGGGVGDGAPVATAAWQGNKMLGDGTGAIFISQSAGDRIRRVSPAGIVSTWAGPVNAWYHGAHPPQFGVDLSSPSRLSTDGAGTIHVYESGPRRIREIAANGSVRLRADAAALGNRFNVRGLASDSSGNLFLSADNAVWRLDQAGVFTAVAGTGTAGYSGDGGPATSAMVSSPSALVRASDGTLYVADYGNDRVRRITPAGVISTLAQVPSPEELLLAPNGDLYVAGRDYRVRRITPAGVVTVVAGNGESTGGYSGNGGPAVNAVLSFIHSLAFTASGDLLIAHAPAVIRRVDAGGTIHPWSGELLGDGLARFETSFNQPTALAVDGQGNILLAHHNRIRRVAPDGVTSTVAGRSGVGSSGDGGPALDALFRTIEAMVVDAAGNIYFSETSSAVVRVVRTNGTVERFAGNGSFSVSGDGGPAVDAGVPWPKGLAVDGQGRLYIASRRSVRRVELDGSITTYAGGLQSGFAGDGGPATQALFCYPTELSFAVGALFIADSCNNRIRRVDAAGIVTTVAGNGSGGRPGEGGLALESPFTLYGAMAIARDGSIFVAQPEDRRIYRIDVDGVVRLAAGNGQPGYGGDGGHADQAGFNYIGPMTVDSSGALFIGDQGINLLRKVTGFTQQPTLPVISIADAAVLEGDTGTSIARFVVSLDRASSGPVGFRVRTQSGTALVGTDLIAPDGGDRVIGVGQLSVEVEVEVIGDTLEESEETFQLVLESVTGAQLGRSAATGTIADNDNATGGPPGGLGAPLARADRRVVAINAPAFLVEVLHNDDFDPANLGASPVTVVGSAQGGQAMVVGDAVRFTPQPGFAGEGGFRYRLCDTQSRCTEAAVAIVLRPIPRRDLEVLSRSGRFTQPLQNLPAMPAAVFRTTQLAAGKTFGMSPSVDDAPASPWNSTVGRTYQFFFLDRDDGAQDVPHIVHVDMLQSTGGEKLDLYLGLDVNGDGWPQEDEVLCMDAQSPSPRCDALMPAPLTDISRYWVMVHNRNPVPARAELVTYDVPLLPSDGSLVATGPGKVPANEAFDLLLSWRDLSLLEGERRLGYVWLETSPGVAAGGFPVRLHRTGNVEEPVLLTPGLPTTVRLAPGRSHRRIFLDVPVGSTRLEVDASAPNNQFTMQLVHAGADNDAADTSVPESPQAGTALARPKRGPAVQAVPQPGRWYVVANNAGVAPGEMTFTANVEGAAPKVRPGSYFNSARPGHGLFLYPAGDQWAGLWYAYANDGGPTWYYLQGLAPGANGVWTGELYRAAWNGSSNRLVDVGVVTVAPTGPDAFTFSYTLDGLSGSEPMASLGRGCPTSAGLPQDLSSHWFDPTRAGTGFSVQMWQDYEYFAAFIYDARGVPRFLAAERSGFGGAESTLALQQLRGSCPTCTFTPSQRSNVGTLLRRVSGGSLDVIELDLEFTHGVPGLWSSIDNLELLGGTGTTQGCVP